MPSGERVSSNLWSESPRERLSAAIALGSADAEVLSRSVASTSPMKPWPYGMPTSVNPFLVVLGPSPGNSPLVGDAAFRSRPPNEVPTVGCAHPGFHYEDARSYWPKIRELSIGMLRGFDASLSESECYAMSGQMNLGVGAFGNARSGAVESAYAEWVPQVLIKTLRPKIVVLVGLLSLLKGNEEVRRWFSASGDIKIDWRKPERELPFQSYANKQMLFRSWSVLRPDSGTTTVVSWPNHPSRSPMTDRAMWRASVREGAAYFASSVGCVKKPA